MNRNYLRSRARELSLKHELERDGYFVIRAAGSKGVADLLAVKPSSCNYASHFDVRFIQVKVSEKIKESKESMVADFSTCNFPFNVEFFYFPVKSKKWHANNKKSKRRLDTRKKKHKRPVRGRKLPQHSRKAQ